MTGRATSIALKPDWQLTKPQEFVLPRLIVAITLLLLKTKLLQFQSFIKLQSSFIENRKAATLNDYFDNDETSSPPEFHSKDIKKKDQKDYLKVQGREHE